MNGFEVIELFCKGEWGGWGSNWVNRLGKASQKFIIMKLATPTFPLTLLQKVAPDALKTKGNEGSCEMFEQKSMMSILCLNTSPSPWLVF